MRIRRATKSLYHDRNVLSVGIGQKASNDSQVPSIVVGVRAKNPREKSIPPGYLVPPTITVPSEGGRPSFEVLTDVVQEKQFYFSPMRLTANAPTYGFAGASIIADGALGGPGRNGAIVRDQFEHTYLLSCHHVITDFGRFQTLGHPIRDVLASEIVAAISGLVPLVPITYNSVDIAVAALLENKPRDNGGSIQGFRSDPLAISDWVRIHSPGGASGRVVQVSKDVMVFGWGGDGSQFCLFEGQLEVEGLGSIGESGSAVVDTDGYLVGVFIADNSGSGIVTPIGTILDELRREVSVRNQPIELHIV
ncbi:MAG: hypothetical protein AAF591_07020 [Verrucomicrobiota bacterium]